MKCRLINIIGNWTIININKLSTYLQHKTDSACMPRFGNHPANLTIQSPRRIINSKKIFIGDDVKLGSNCTLKALTGYPGGWMKHPESKHIENNFDSEIWIGHRVTASGSLYLSAAKKISIEDDVMLASNIYISDCTHGHDHAEIPYKYQGITGVSPILIKKGSWIGQNVVVMPGVTVGEMSIIGANSVVTADVPDKCLAVGVPARIIKKWSREEKRWVDWHETDKRSFG